MNQISTRNPLEFSMIFFRNYTKFVSRECSTAHFRHQLKHVKVAILLEKYSRVDVSILFELWFAWFAVEDCCNVAFGNAPFTELPEQILDRFETHFWASLESRLSKLPFGRWQFVIHQNLPMHALSKPRDWLHCTHEENVQFKHLLLHMIQNNNWINGKLTYNTKTYKANRMQNYKRAKRGGIIIIKELKKN